MSEPHRYYTAADVASRCEESRQHTPHSWRAMCPVHQGDNPTSLSITDGVDEDGAAKTLLFCHAHQCSAEDICRALGIEVENLFAVPQRPSAVQAPRARPHQTALRQLADRQDALDVVSTNGMLTTDMKLAMLLDMLADDVNILQAPDARQTLATAIRDPLTKAMVEQRLRKAGMFPPTIFALIDTETTDDEAALIDAMRFPFVDDRPTMPPLPNAIRCEKPEWTTWLDSYASHSAYWAPRAATGYHAAVGLWVLSTVAARRIVLHMGSTEVYPTLFLALIAPSTTWTKTTAAALGIRFLRRAGCGHLLAPDRTTPQFLLKLMSGIVPQNYGQLTDDEQQTTRDSLAFTAQRGWFYEEWGGMLKQMRRTDSPHAELNKLLIVLEGGAETFETGTIQRGLERINAPYLALLGNATPHDLAPFMEEGNAWWHDGFWPRFAFVTPPWEVEPSREPQPREHYTIPEALLTSLHRWHQRLGSRTVHIEEKCNARGKPIGEWQARTGPLPCHAMTCAAEVYDAYEAYNDALLELVHTGNVHEDLAAWYGRAHEKALRVAMLLTSLDNETTITLPYWREGQCMVESWRKNMHELCALAGKSVPKSPEAILETKIITVCAQTGGMTARELRRRFQTVSSDTLYKVLASMVKIGVLTLVKAGRKTIYTVFTNDEEVLAMQGMDEEKG